MSNLAPWAREIAREHLETPLPRRWAHTQGVARQARTLVPTLGERADLLEAAAWLHDVGYAPDITATGFHPLDGARFLRDVHHADEHLCRLVAHHSCAVVEARERGLDGDLTAEFGKEAPDLTDSLIYCDMTTSPDGEHLPVEQRLAEILDRYGSDHLVARSIATSSPYLVDTVHRVQSEANSAPIRE
ncbi:HD domain-containing protein [Actinomadura parmotrematis]|uniref:HD domain-containing protein n=1 Tax=Actinomadura parmotrematis TaxID=2864039 RepID=A0ABS7FPG7_9ACTN|nr:HD domain-containing protein [Actinomadura parmotrematis]MBW8482256.1 HD domain-containing protein [Actinomadura parmotrematis]